MVEVTNAVCSGTATLSSAAASQSQTKDNAFLLGLRTMLSPNSTHDLRSFLYIVENKDVSHAMDCPRHALAVAACASPFLLYLLRDNKHSSTHAEFTHAMLPPRYP